MNNDKSFRKKRKITLNDFEFINKSQKASSNLGQGAYGKVFLVRYKSSKK